MVSPSFDLPWVEKYRPQLLSDMVGTRLLASHERVGNEPIIERLKVVAAKGNMPHLLLAVQPRSLSL